MTDKMSVLPTVTMWLPLITIIVLFLGQWLCIVDGLSISQEAPTFIQEPPMMVDFANSTGAVIPCSARGDPAPVISWIVAEGTTSYSKQAAIDIPGLRHVRQDGALVFPPFNSDNYKQEVHSATYRCLAYNSVGVTGSRNVRVRGVNVQSYAVDVYDEFVIAGNTAVLRCHIPGFMKDFVTVNAWITDATQVIPVNALSGDRYSVFPSGEIHVRRVDINDSEKRFQCQTRNRLTNEIVTSETFGRIIVNEPVSNVMPRITDMKRQLEVRENEPLSLPCAAQAHPIPTYTWYRKEGSRHKPINLGDKWQQVDGSLILTQPSVQDSGKYVCFVNNTLGSDTGYTDLLVTAPLSVRVEPKEQTVDVGSSATFNCTHSGYPILAVEWYKDQQPLRGHSRVRFLNRLSIQILSVQREDTGIYQCYVTNKDESAQGVAQLSLEVDAPKLISTFESEKIHPGISLSLKCSAYGNPLPQVTWMLDGYPIPDSSRFRMGDYVKSDATVVSYVNITSTKPEDGGFYSCKAANDVGTVEHVEKLNVFGPPFVRPMRNMTVPAGTNMKIQCPVGGFPIDSVSWEKEGLRLPYNHRQRPFPNGTLIVQTVEQVHDEGRYACIARNTDGQVAQNSLHITVTVRPHIEPFTFPKSLQQGQRYSVLCSVTKGDPPIKMIWMKDGAPVSDRKTGSDGVHSIAVTEFSSTLVFESLRPDHRGNYTCVASNSVGTASHHATMVIHVPPRWKLEPEATFVVQGLTLLLDCQAEGFPLPRIRWSKSIGESEFKAISSSSRVQVFENGSLALQNAQQSDAGSYLCQASNGIGTGLSKVVPIAVKVAAHFESKYKTESVRKGQNARLKCESLGDKPIAIAWFKDKQQFDPDTDPRYESKETVLSNGIISEVIILRADRRDSALYSCSATNSFGQDETNIQLVIQEAPDPPQDLKVTEYASRTVRLHWVPPYSGNSPILEYLVQYKTDTDKWHTRAFNASVPGGESEVVVKGLYPVTQYSFRVTAINAIGRSEYSTTITVRTNEEAPGGPPLKIKVIPIGSQSIKVTWKPPRRDLHYGEIKGYYVGYKMGGTTDTYVYKTLETDRDSESDQCLLSNLKRFTKYSVIVQAYNAQGAGPPSDEVIVQTFENDPPSAPNLKLSSTTPTSIAVSWEMDNSDVTPISGFILRFRKESGVWAETKLPGATRHHVVSHLHCGARYVFRITAFNNVGKGEESEIFTAKTDGAAPMAPDKQSILSVNISSVLLRLDKWHDGGCPITHFLVKHKLQRHKQWSVTAANIPGTTKTHIIGGLSAGTWYDLQITATNEAGPTEAVYTFLTLDKDKTLLLPANVQESTIGVPFYLDWNVILPAVISFAVVIMVVVFVCVLMKKRRSSESRTGIYSPQKGHDPENMHLNYLNKTMVTLKKQLPDESPLQHKSPGVFYPSPYATTDIGLSKEHSKEHKISDEPLYATVKRTPRPPKSDLHIYHYPDDFRRAVAKWKEPFSENSEEYAENSISDVCFSTVGRLSSDGYHSNPESVSVRQSNNSTR